MAKRKSYLDAVREMQPERRLELAIQCVEQLTYRIQEVLDLFASCEIICYSDVLSKQIPPSRAAHTFNVLSDSTHKYLIIKIISIWDRPSENAISIPQVVELIDDEEVIRIISKRTFHAHANRGARLLNPSKDQTIQAEMERIVRESGLEFAERQAEMAEKTIAACITAVRGLRKGELHGRLTNLRNSVVHSLTQTRRELTGEVPRAKYGDEQVVLEKTISILEDLYCWVNGTSFNISTDCLRIARKNAEELWGNCTFQIPE